MSRTGVRFYEAGEPGYYSGAAQRIQTMLERAARREAEKAAFREACEAEKRRLAEKTALREAGEAEKRREKRRAAVKTAGRRPAVAAGFAWSVHRTGCVVSARLEDLAQAGIPAEVKLVWTWDTEAEALRARPKRPGENKGHGSAFGLHYGRRWKAQLVRRAAPGLPPGPLACRREGDGWVFEANAERRNASQ